MPNVTSIEPRILVDLLALTVRHIEATGQATGFEVVVISAWLSNVELAVQPTGHHTSLGASRKVSSMRLADCLKRMIQRGCTVRVAVLGYGVAAGAMTKEAAAFPTERNLLRELLTAGAEIYLCPNLHAKGVVTPLGLITGATNYTNRGLYAQMQNANYFAATHPDYEANRRQLLSNLQADYRVTSIP